MARLLNKLAQQPKPLLNRMNLDAQPERPLLQRLLSRLPQRRPGERYAFKFEPLGFLSRQPQSPLLAGISLWKQPKVSNTAWVNKAPLETFAASNSSLLGQMDSHRVPGIVTAVLLLGLSLNYLLGLSNVTETSTEEVAETSEPTTETEAVEATATTALTPQEENDVAGKEAVAVATSANLMAAAKEDKAEAASPDPVIVSAPSTEEPATIAAAKDEAPAPDVVSKPAPESVASPAPKPIAPVEAKSEAAPPLVATPVPEPTAPMAAKPAPMAAKADTPKEKAPAEKVQLADETATQPMKMEAASVATTAKPGESPEEVTDVSAETPSKASTDTEQSPADEAAPIDPSAVKNPRTLSAERSKNVMNSAQYIYLLGDGPLALERLGMALNAGHVHEDFVEPFKSLEAGIRRLLVLFEQAKSTENPKLAGQSRAAFMDAEEKIFPGELSAYAAHLENLAIEEMAPQQMTPRPTVKKNYGPR